MLRTIEVAPNERPGIRYGHLNFWLDTPELKKLSSRNRMLNILDQRNAQQIPPGVPPELPEDEPPVPDVIPIDDPDRPPHEPPPDVREPPQTPPGKPPEWVT